MSSRACVPGRGGVTLTGLVTAIPSSPNPSWRRDFLLLAVAFGALYFFALGKASLGSQDEGRYSEIPREMVASGDWVTPRLDGVNYFEKPPLVYWAVAVCLKAFGPGELSMRTVPVLFALGGLLLTYAAARQLYGREAGLASATVLGTSLLYFTIGHILLLDMALSVWMSATLFCFLLGVRAPVSPAWWNSRRALFYGLYASAALATLTKGFIGFLVTGAVMVLWLVLFDQWKRLRPLYLPTGLLLFLAVALPWHLLAAARNPTWAYRYIVYEHWLRFTTPAAGRHQAWWFFIPIVLFGLFPWVGFLWPALRDALRGGWERRRENAAAWFLVTWVVFVFLFFSKSQSKLAPYILPVFPPLAVIVGRWLAGPGKDLATLRGGLRVFSFVCGLLAAGVLVAVLKVGVAIKDPAQAFELRPYAFVLAPCLLLGGALTPVLARRGRWAAYAGIAATMVLLFGIVALARPAIDKPGTQLLARIVKSRGASGDEVVHYHEFFPDFTFYAGRLADVVEFKGELELEEDAAARASGRFMDESEFRRRWAGPARVLALARKSDTTELFADPAFHYHLLAETRDHYLFSNQP
jgi:4-amino-4-deoxy-L-arabinose transferase-like glycosyltransferase